MWKIAGSLLLGLSWAMLAFAAPLGTVTVADGRAHVLRGVEMLIPAEGVNLDEGDLIEVEEGGLLQIELADGSALSFASGARLRLPAPLNGKPADLLLAAGWAKLSPLAPSQVPGLATAQLRLATQNTTLVGFADAQGTQVFSEAGDLVASYGASKPGQPALIKSGDFVAVKTDFSVVSARRPPAAFVAAMPRVYLDKLPARLARIKVRNVEARHERDAGFADLDAWVARLPAARAALLAQFEPRLKDAAFLGELAPRIQDYPEWEAVLRPEKTRGKDKSKTSPKAPPKKAQ